MNLKAVYGEYLEHSCRYYHMDHSVVDDAYYDGLCKTLLANWDNFEHRHKGLCDESALFAGSGFQLPFTTLLWPVVLLCMAYPDTPLKEVFK